LIHKARRAFVSLFIARTANGKVTSDKGKKNYGMKDIASLVKSKEAAGRELLGRILGPNADFEAVSMTALALLPEATKELQELCVFFEGEMLRCRDGGAYFAGCLAGAAMIESFLLSICILERKAVEDSRYFRSLKKNKNLAFEKITPHWTLKELIPLTEELEWIGPETVDLQLVTALVEGYREMLPVARPGMTDQDMVTFLSDLKERPDVALLELMQSMRNLVHGGRCLRLRKRLASADFADWAKLVMIVTVEIRNCLLTRLQSIYGRYLRELANSPEGLAAFAKLFVQLSAARPTTGAQ
jgi:hypothetical protein